MTILIEVAGVLRTETGDPVLGTIIPVRAMMESVRVVFSSEADNEDVFLRREGLGKYANLRIGPLLESLAAERTMGNVDLVITPSTEAAQSIHRQGISVMLCSPSRAVNPLWSPERKSWGELMEDEDG